MRNLLAFTAALALTVAGVGWYLGWFTIHSEPAESGHRNVEMDINATKARHDLKTGVSEVKKVGETVEQKSGDAPNQTPPATPPDSAPAHASVQHP